MDKYKNQSSAGFTIVELVVILAVLVVLIIITATNYNGIRTRTLASNAENNAKFLQKKVQAYFNANNRYPTAATATTNLNSQTSSNLEGVVTLGTPTVVNGERTMRLQICTSGYTITYWDYSTSALPSTPQISGGATITGCANAT